jgi:hypothetical protein
MKRCVLALPLALVTFCLLTTGRPAAQVQERDKERAGEKELAALQGSWRTLR